MIAYKTKCPKCNDYFRPENNQKYCSKCRSPSLKDDIIKAIGEKFYEREELSIKVKVLTEELRFLTDKLRK